MNGNSQINALSPENAGETCDFRIRIRSVTVSLGVAERDTDEQFVPASVREAERSEAVTTTVESVSLASVALRDGRITVSYEESPEGFGECVPTVLSFDPDQPGIVDLERRGALRTYFVFEEGKYHRATYKTPYGGFEMTIFSRRVENALTVDGGTLRLEYFVEFRGAAEEKASLDIEVTRL